MLMQGALSMANQNENDDNNDDIIIRENDIYDENHHITIQKQQ
jgi:hypothetical protein